MGIYELTVLAIVIIGVGFHYGRAENKYKFIYVAMFMLFLLSALRSGIYSGDTIRYMRYYDRYASYSFNQMLELYKEGLTKDPTYHMTAWLFSRVFENSQWWIAFLSAIFCFAVGRLIYKKSLVPIVSIVMYITLGYFSFSMTGLRQSVGIVIILLSYPFLERRKLIPFVIMILLASLYHTTAIVFLIAYPFATMKFGKYHIIAAIFALAVFYLFRTQLLEALNSLLGEQERFQNYISGEAHTLTMSGFIIQCFIFAFAMFYYRRMVNKDKNNLVLYNLSFFGLAFQLYSSFIAEMFRISMYFSIFNIILIANVTDCEGDARSKEITQAILIGVLLLYMLSGGMYQYKFFWETL